MISTESSKSVWNDRLFVFGVSTLGGLFAVFGAIYQEFLNANALLLFMVAPLIEEALKPIGLILLMEQKPERVPSRLDLVLGAVWAALIFATIENWIYLHFYIQEPTQAIIHFRYLVCTSLHICCTAIVGFGLGRDLKGIQSGNKMLNIERLLPFFVIAVVLHALFNLTAFVLSFS